MVDTGSVGPADLFDVAGSLAVGDAPAIGRFRVDLATEQWWWSEEIYSMHGFEQGEVHPTTRLLLAHKHPDDRDRVDHLWREAAETGMPFSSVHRVIGGDGVTRTLGIVGQGRRAGDDGRVTELVGYFIDLTDSHRRASQRHASASIRAAAASRAVIDQAKGALMVVLDVDDEAAFTLLREASNRSNVAVRDLSAEVVAFLRGGVATGPDAAARLRELLGAR